MRTPKAAAAPKNARSTQDESVVETAGLIGEFMGDNSNVTPNVWPPTTGGDRKLDFVSTIK